MSHEKMQAEIRHAMRIRNLSDEVLASHIRAALLDRANGYPRDYGQEYLDEQARREMTPTTPTDDR